MKVFLLPIQPHLHRLPETAAGLYDCIAGKFSSLEQQKANLS